MRRISRRRAIRYGAAAAAALTIPAWIRAYSDEPSGSVELPQPKVLSSTNGELSLTLTAVQSVVDMGAARPITTYTYDNVVPGYTWEVNPGDTLKVDLVNNLPSIDDHPHSVSPAATTSADLALLRCLLPLSASHSTGPAPAAAGGRSQAVFSAWQDLFNPPRPHQWTNTNLHTHGLHVSPTGNADNIFLDIAPGGRQSYEIPIPPDHRGGLFWYHPHRHGAVTQQARAGMAGIIIVRGDIDEVEEVRAAKEQVIVLQTIELGPDYHLMDPIPAPTTKEAFYPRTQILYTVNGVLTPKISMYPGEVQRWRLLNAAEGKFLSLRLEGHDFKVLAWDGLNLAAPDPTNVLSLYFEYTVQRQPDDTFVSFGVDGVPFDPDRPPYQMRLGTAEEWTLVNAHDHKLSRHAHGLHIHTNPFKITAINGKALARPLWRDTYELSGRDNDSLAFVSNFVDYTGKFVEHCHVLSHEDLGMMESLEVIP